MMDVGLFCSLLVLMVPAPAAGDDGWSVHTPAEVRAMEGYPAVLPCRFSHPQHATHTGLKVLWRLGHGEGAIILLRCFAQPGASACEPEPQQDPRYRLEGNPREHDLSLRINGAALQDSGRYYCRLELQGREHGGYEDKMGTRLRVEAPPRILSVWVEGSEASGFTAYCLAQGAPLPDVRWAEPDRTPEGGGPLGQGSTGHFQVVGELRGATAGRHYICDASNPLGKGQATLYLLAPRPPPPSPPAWPPLLLLLALGLGTKVVLLLGVGGWAAWTLGRGKGQLLSTR